MLHTLNKTVYYEESKFVIKTQEPYSIMSIHISFKTPLQ